MTSVSGLFCNCAYAHRTLRYSPLGLSGLGPAVAERRLAEEPARNPPDSSVSDNDEHC